ncbi:hypothetical protein [Luteimonas sp. RC10]|uniref:hypothetical protein n=1 Tax=Luteimonas sp. RC10 TaxID=2587035 RepID=UPI00161CBCEA|nr:hypothetical protein [Luteimonas sp. RC10]MBB3343529.1 hypothetical protein [Luteimonas sp. RC10]
MRRWASGIATGLLLAFVAGTAGAADGLSGTYRPVDEDPATSPADAQLTLRAEGRGWLAMFRGEGLAMLPLSGREQAALFPGVAPEAGLQCASSSAFLMCRVAPGTVFPDQKFTSTTGYFSAFSDTQIHELQRID